MLKIPEELVSRIIWNKPLKNEEAAQPTIKEIVSPIQDCPDCGKRVRNRMIYKKLAQTPRDHWREQCQSCKNFKNPLTGKFDVKFDKVQAFFRSYFSSSAK